MTTCDWEPFQILAVIEGEFTYLYIHLAMGLPINSKSLCQSSSMPFSFFYFKSTLHSSIPLFATHMDPQDFFFSSLDDQPSTPLARGDFPPPPGNVPSFVSITLTGLHLRVLLMKMLPNPAKAEK